MRHVLGPRSTFALAASLSRLRGEVFAGFVLTNAPGRADLNVALWTLRRFGELPATPLDEPATPDEPARIPALAFRAHVDELLGIGWGSFVRDFERLGF